MAQLNPSIDPALCPLCGKPNDCQLCTDAAYKGPCWCAKVRIPEALLARVPGESRNKACICRGCVMDFHRTNAGTTRQTVMPGDFYFDPGGLLVFTAAYLLRRGFCCGSGCRHCPYPGVTLNIQPKVPEIQAGPPVPPMTLP